MKQTAVEWLVNELERDDSKIARVIGLKKYNFIIRLAKEMEKQQIIDAWNDGNNQYSGIGDSETYYNETFNLSQQDKP
jgi:hypothetical protein